MKTLILLLSMVLLYGCPGCAKNPPEEPEIKPNPVYAKFTDLNRGQCSYWNQDIEPYQYTSISCWKWLNHVMNNQSKITECILKDCKSCTRDIPNLILYQGDFTAAYGYLGGDGGLYYGCEESQ